MDRQRLITQLDIALPSRLQQIYPTWRNAERYTIYVKRDDLIHPVISGNKWRKLSHTLELMANTENATLGSFGGGYSNHLHALSFCCWQLDWPLTVFVRGDYANRETSMLLDIQRWGTRVVYLTKKDYQMRSSQPFCAMLSNRYALSHLIPEGGSHQDCFSGMAALMNEFEHKIDYLLLPVASSGTLAGMAVTSGNVSNLVGIGVLKGANYLEQQTRQLIDLHPVLTDYSILHNYHFGGYAKSPENIRSFCQHTSQMLGIPIEPVYSGKTFYALKDLIERAAFPIDSTLCVLHTGGLQGSRDSSKS